MLSILVGHSYSIHLDPKQLEHYGLGITDVINAINANNSNAGGGRVSRGDQSYVIRGVGLIRNLEDIGAIVVSQVNGTPVTVIGIAPPAFDYPARTAV